MADFAPKKGMSAKDIAEVVAAILEAATLEEKVAMMSGHGFFKAMKEDNRVWAARPYRAGGGLERLGVPAFYFTDGPRGVAGNRSTCFPCSMARGASFDPDLERRIGEVMGIEARVNGCNLSGAVCFNLLRHPAWGRAQETYGEDPFHLGEMGAALAQGIQTHNVVASAKHFALNSMENARFKVDVRIDERALHEVYLPHFKRAIEAGCASIMSAYNQINGEYCGQNRVLLTDILRGEWGFDGFVHSDWVMGVYKLYGAAAGLDVENPEPLVFGQKLIDAVHAGTIEPEVIDRACTRILTTLYRFAAAEDPLPDYPATLRAPPAHIALAREAAEKSAVLLKNEGILPLSIEHIGTLAVFGKLAALENTGDNGSSKVMPPYVVTPLEGLTRALGAARIVTGDEDNLEAVRRSAATADAIVVVVGTTARDEGEFIPGDIALGADAEKTTDGIAADEDAQKSNTPSKPLVSTIGGDRDTLNLNLAQQALIDAAASAEKPLIVVIVSGSAIMVEGWHENADAILQTFYAGMEGGTALASLLFGAVSPSGKLPFSVATDVAHYPVFDKDAASITYDLWHGYSKLDRDGNVPRYGFGHGLSYTRFVYRAAKARVAAGTIQTQVSVTNVGAVTADEIVQAYVGFPGQAIERQKMLLKGFQRVTLAPGETKTVHIAIAIDALRWRCAETHDWVLEKGAYDLFFGGNSRDLLTASFVL
jgi:beta-glucosidase